MNNEKKGWKKVRLGDVCEFNYGKSLTAINRIPGNIPVYSSAGITGSHNEALVNNKGIIVGRKGTVGTVYFSDAPFYCIDTAYYILENDEKFNFKYLYYRLKSLNLDKLNEDSAVPGLNRETAYKQAFSLPPLPTQQKIASILGSLDDKIELNNRMNANLEEQAQALFKRWFVDFEFPNEEGKPYRSSGGEMVESEMGLIPKGWKVGTFTSFVDIQGGGTPSTTNSSFWNGNIPFFTPKDAENCCFTHRTEKSITYDGLNSCNSKLYNENTVFITARGTVGKVSMAARKMAMNQSCYALTGKDLDQYFVYNLTLSIVSLLKNKANGAVFDAITTRDFDCETIIFPEKSIIDRFISIVSPYYDLIKERVSESLSLAQLRDTLLPKLMSGEVEV